VRWTSSARVWSTKRSREEPGRRGEAYRTNGRRRGLAYAVEQRARDLRRVTTLDEPPARRAMLAALPERPPRYSPRRSAGGERPPHRRTSVRRITPCGHQVTVDDLHSCGTARRRRTARSSLRRTFAASASFAGGSAEGARAEAASIARTRGGSSSVVSSSKIASALLQPGTRGLDVARGGRLGLGDQGLATSFRARPREDVQRRPQMLGPHSSNPHR